MIAKRYYPEIPVQMQLKTQEANPIKHHKTSKEHCISGVVHGNEDSIHEALTPFCGQGFEDGVESLVERGGVRVDARTSLLTACRFGHRDIADLLLRHGSDAGLKGCDGTTALMEACKHGHEALVELMLKHVGDVDARDRHGNTALMVACKSGHKRIVGLLFTSFADVNAVNNSGRTPLSFAVRSESFDIVKLLIEYGADVNDSDVNGASILMDACNVGNGKIVELLLENGACVHTTSVFSGSALVQTCCRGGNSLRVLELLVKHSADVNEGRGGEATPLMTACQMGLDVVVDFLLRNGADVNATHGGGKTVLMFISNKSRTNEKMGQVLLQYGANTNARDERGKTVLMKACCEGQNKFVDLLLKHGAEVDAQCKDGMTASMYAVENGRLNCLKMLVRAGASLDLTSKTGGTVLSHAMARRGNVECLRFLFEEGKLMQDGHLKSVHQNAPYTSNALDCVLWTIRLGVFEWEFCTVRDFKPICYAAMASGYCPGKITYRCNDALTMFVSPLVVAFFENDIEAAKTFLTHIYYLPEDLKTLAAEKALGSRLTDSWQFDRISLRPLSLFTWSFLKVSQAISKAGAPNTRQQRIEALLIPRLVKNRLNFRID